MLVGERGMNPNFNDDDEFGIKAQIQELYGLVSRPEIFGFILFLSHDQIYTGKPDALWTKDAHEAHIAPDIFRIMQVVEQSQLPANQLRVGILFLGDEVEGKRELIPYDVGMTVAQIRDIRQEQVKHHHH